MVKSNKMKLFYTNLNRIYVVFIFILVIAVLVIIITIIITITQILTALKLFLF